MVRSASRPKQINAPLNQKGLVGHQQRPAGRHRWRIGATDGHNANTLYHWQVFPVWYTWQGDQRGINYAPFRQLVDKINTELSHNGLLVAAAMVFFH